MKILTTENNPAVLKLIVAANLSKKNIACEKVTQSEKKNPAFPALELDSGNIIFSVNQASRFLFPPVKSVEQNVDHWLEWDASQLQPAVAASISARGKYDPRLSALLANLDTALTDSDYVIKGKLTVADVCVWGSLYPVLADGKICDDLVSSKKNIYTWWWKLLGTVAFETALKTSGLGLGVTASEFMCSTWHASNYYQGSGSTGSANAEPSAAAVVDKKQKTKAAATSLEQNFSQMNISAAPVAEKELQNAATSWKNGFKTKPKGKVNPVLPTGNERNILITSALPYVNNVPHLGNIIGCVLSADVFARYCRLKNYNTLYISGTDEYGTATETKALEEGLQPREICDKYNAIHNDIYSWFNIDFDLFSRTTIDEQSETTQEMFLRLHKLGYMLTEPMEQLLCQKCDRFLADRFVEGTCPKCAYEDARGDQCDGCGTLINATELIKPRCKLCGDMPVIRNSDQYFLDLPKIEPKLLKWFETSSKGWTHNARVITKSWLKDGLRSRCITRDLKWGIPVPMEGFRNKVFYVWFDAPIGYMSMTKKYSDKWREWWQPKKDVKVEYWQFMAKDNVPFHSIMFPSTLLAADEGYTTATNIIATEYLNYEDGKFSKSRGVGVFGNDARDTGIPADYWRFYLLFVRPESQDSSFSWDDLALRINTELLNNLGNFVNRALMFVEKNFNSTIPEIHLEQEDLTLLALVNREVSAYVACLENAKLRDGLRHILSVSRHGNQYIQAQQPWVKTKGSPEDKNRAGTIVGVGANISCLLSILLQPYMPEVSKQMQQQMNAPTDINVITESAVMLLKPGHCIGKPSPLFTKIESAQTDQLKQKFAGKQNSSAPSSKPAKHSKPVANGIPVGESSETVAQLQAAVDKQANLVRELKSSGKPKAEWQPHVTTLLQLKADLAAAQKTAATAAPTVTAVASMEAGGGSASEVADLEAAIKKQGDLVREMKGAGKSKAEVQPEVNKLLQLKQQLSALLPPTAAPEAASTATSGGKKNKKRK